MGRTNVASGGSGIKNVQQGELVYTTAEVINVTVDAVSDVNNCVVISRTMPETGSNIGDRMVLGKLTSPTNIKFECADGSSAIRVGWQLIEFENLKSIQSGYLEDADMLPYLDVAIDAVDRSKSVLYFDYRCSLSNVLSAYAHASGYLYSDTGIRFRAAIGSDSCLQWYVVEFK